LTPGVIFDDFNSAIPDVVFLNHRQLSSIGSGERITEAPDLVIEIVSPGRENARCDREVKRQVYGKHGVKEYWIADPDMRSLEIYRLESSALKLVVTLTDEDEITTPMLPGFRCKSHQIF
ncbi:MAG: Uma2 family endonuclease, partial [Pyrinomonadaceae bacterium]